jgi:hypothetical protein
MELEAFEQRPTKSGLTHYGAPEGLHDDTVIARALMWRGIQSAPLKRRDQSSLTEREQVLKEWYNQRR